MKEYFPGEITQLQGILEIYGIPSDITSERIKSLYRSAVPDNYAPHNCAEMNILALFRNPEDPPNLIYCLHDFEFGCPTLERQITMTTEVALTNTEQTRLFWRAASQFPQPKSKHMRIDSCAEQLRKQLSYPALLIPVLEIKLFLDYYWME